MKTNKAYAVWRRTPSRRADYIHSYYRKKKEAKKVAKKLGCGSDGSALVSFYHNVVKIKIN
jgi:hypothetical protein